MESYLIQKIQMTSLLIRSLHHSLAARGKTKLQKGFAAEPGRPCTRTLRHVELAEHIHTYGTRQAHAGTVSVCPYPYAPMKPYTQLRTTYWNGVSIIFNYKIHKCYCISLGKTVLKKKRKH